eukprot:3272348-Pleurochrysis_carterae.AAC.1
MLDLFKRPTDPPEFYECAHAHTRSRAHARALVRLPLRTALDVRMPIAFARLCECGAHATCALLPLRRSSRSLLCLSRGRHPSFAAV